MHIHSDTVSEAVVEVFAVTSFFNNITCCSIDFAGSYTWFDKIKGSELSFQTDIVNIFLELVRVTNSYGTCHI